MGLFKKLFWLVIVLVIVLLVVNSCAPKQKDNDGTVKVKGTLAGEVEDRDEGGAAEETTLEEDEEEVDNTEEIEETTSEDEESNEEAEVPISQEDLDKLKEEIEGISTDDLGGLSE